jgi:hypothetical protein
LHIPFIQKKAIGGHIAGKEQIREVIIIDIAYGYAASVIEIIERQDIVCCSDIYLQFIREINPGFLRRQTGEQGRVRLRIPFVSGSGLITGGKDGKKEKRSG